MIYNVNNYLYNFFYQHGLLRLFFLEQILAECAFNEFPHFHIDH